MKQPSLIHVKCCIVSGQRSCAIQPVVNILPQNLMALKKVFYIYNSCSNLAAQIMVPVLIHGHAGAHILLLNIDSFLYLPVTIFDMQVLKKG